MRSPTSARRTSTTAVLQQERGRLPTPEFDRDDPTAADGWGGDNDDFLQYYLGAYIYASPGNTFDDEAGHPYPLHGRGGRSVRGPVVDVRRDQHQQPGATRRPSWSPRRSWIRPATRCTPTPRAPPRWLRPGRGAVRPLQRRAVHGRRGGQPGDQAARGDARPVRQPPHRGPELQVLGRPRGPVGLRGRRGARRHDRPELGRVDHAARGGHGRRRARGTRA